MILTWPGKGLLRQIVMSSYPWDKPVSGIHAHRGTPGGGGTWVNFCWICAAGSLSPYSILVYFLANDRPHLSHFLENVIFTIPT